MRYPRRIMTALGMSGAATAAVVSLLAGSGAHSPAAAGSGREAWSASGQAAEIVYYYLPATGAQYAIGAEFAGIYSALQDDVVSACLARSGFQLPRIPAAVYAAQDVDNSQWPDLSAISRTGILDPGLRYGSPSIAVPPADTPVYQADYARCEKVQQGIFAPMTRAGGDLLGQWLGLVAKVQGAAPLRSAMAGFAACVERAGTPVSWAGSFNYFLAWVTGREAMAPARAGAIAVDQRWAAVFARCAGPAVTVQDRLELAQQASFLTGHRQQVLALETIASQLTSSLEHRYGGQG